MSNPTRQTAPASNNKKGLLIAMALVSLTSLGFAAYAWQTKSPLAATHEAAAPRVTSYTKLEPTFIVNLADDGVVRYMQADVQIVTADPATQQAIATHTPALRNRILLLLGQQTSASVNTRAGKEALQKAALSEVKSVLKSEKAPGDVASVLFTSMVVQ